MEPLVAGANAPPNDNVFVPNFFFHIKLGIVPNLILKVLHEKPVTCYGTSSMQSAWNLGGRIGINPIPSLQNLSAMSIDVVLWNTPDVRNLTENLRFARFPENLNHSLEKIQTSWEEIEDYVREKVTLLPLPELMKEKVDNFLKPIGMEILQWKFFHERKCHFGINMPKEFCWTFRGNIDREKTALLFINDQTEDASVRYKLACTYCLESYIKKLWRENPDKLKFLCRKKQPPGAAILLDYWTRVMKGEAVDQMLVKLPDEIRSQYVNILPYIFDHEACRFNAAAVECFWQKLSPEDKRESLPRAAMKAMGSEYFLRSRWIYGDYRNEVLLFLFSLMEDEHQKIIFKDLGCNILQCFLGSSQQNLFMEVANRFWNVLSYLEYMHALQAITDRVAEGYEDYDYYSLFTEFWMQSPKDYKRYVILQATCLNLQEGKYWQNKVHLDLVRDLFLIGDETNIQLILKDATLLEYEKIIYYYRKKKSSKIFSGAKYALEPDEEKMLHKNLLDLLKKFLREERKKQKMKERTEASNKSSPVQENSQNN